MRVLRATAARICRVAEGSETRSDFKVEKGTEGGVGGEWEGGEGGGGALFDQSVRKDEEEEEVSHVRIKEIDLSRVY